MNENNIRAIIVEDEEEGMNVLSIKLKENCPNVTIIDKCYTYDEAVKSIENNNPDLVFLDVRLDRKTGFDVLKRLAYIYFEVIFITGYNEYVQQALRAGALDYILKPVDITELQRAVEKAHRNINRLQNITRIIVPISGGIRIIPVKDIIYCLADNNFTKIYLVNEKKYIHANSSLNRIGFSLPSKQFHQIHRQSIVNLCFVNEFRRADGGYVIMRNGDELSIARERRDGFMESLKGTLDFCED